MFAPPIAPFLDALCFLEKSVCARVGGGNSKPASASVGCPAGFACKQRAEV